MGLSRLLAKGWGVFCVFALAYALVHAAPAGGMVALPIALRLATAGLLFLAMGLLFIAGFGVAAGSGPFLRRLVPRHLLPGFNELIFAVFALASFAVQMFLMPAMQAANPLALIRPAVDFAVPGQAQLALALGHCHLDGGRLTAAAFAWLLAFIFLGSSLSRVRLAAGILRLERKARPELLTAGGTALLLGGAVLFFLQLIYLGEAYSALPCPVWGGIGGDLLIGQSPLLLAYLTLAAFANLLATAEEA